MLTPLARVGRRFVVGSPPAAAVGDLRRVDAPGVAAARDRRAGRRVLARLAIASVEIESVHAFRASNAQTCQDSPSLSFACGAPWRRSLDAAAARGHSITHGRVSPAGTWRRQGHTLRPDCRPSPTPTQSRSTTTISCPRHHSRRAESTTRVSTSTGSIEAPSARIVARRGGVRSASSATPARTRPACDRDCARRSPAPGRRGPDVRANSSTRTSRCARTG